MMSTELDLYPDEPSLHIEGMQLGSGVNACTGDVTETALKGNFSRAPRFLENKSDRFETHVLKYNFDASEVYPDHFVLRDSITFPSNRKAFGTKMLFGSNRTTSPSCTSFIALDWYRTTTSRIRPEPELRKEASKMRAENSERFRHKYGDYFVSRISHVTRFTIIWACRAENDSCIDAFHVNLPFIQISSDTTFDERLRSLARTHEVELDVLSCTCIGDITRFEPDIKNPIFSLAQFRDRARPLPYDVTLRHYNTLNDVLPLSTTIPLSDDLYLQTREAVSIIQSLLFLADVIPGSSDLIRKRYQQIDDGIAAIYASRHKEPDSLSRSLLLLRDLYESMGCLLQRYRLISRARAITYGILKKNFSVFEETEDGAWLKGRTSYRLGLVNFSPLEEEKYSLKHEQICELEDPQHIRYSASSVLNLDGTVPGYVVGLVAEDCSGNNSSSLYIGNDLVLGTNADIHFKVKSSLKAGTHWKLSAWYVPMEAIDDSGTTIF